MADSKEAQLSIRRTGIQGLSGLAKCQRTGRKNLFSAWLAKDANQMLG